MSEIRQIQQVLQTSGFHSGLDNRHHSSHNNDQNSHLKRSGELSLEVWNILTEERQQRLKLDHVIRQMELDILEVKNQMQSCKARLQIQSTTWQHCCAMRSCIAAPGQQHCCPCREEVSSPSPRPTSLFTLV